MGKIDPRRIVSCESPGMLRVRKVIAQSRELLDGHTIAERAHVSFTTFANTYRHLLIRANLIHVAGWRNNFRGPFLPLYGHGPLVGDPPPLPQKVDLKQRAKEWKERTGYLEAKKAQRRFARPPDPILAALMGLPSRYHHYPKNTTNAGTAGREELTA